MQIVFKDNGLHQALAPFTLMRPVAEIRFGILSFRESWELYLSDSIAYTIAYETEDYLYPKFKKSEAQTVQITIAGNIKPTKAIAQAVLNLSDGEALYVKDKWIALKGLRQTSRNELEDLNICSIEKPWHIFQKNNAATAIDFELLTAHKKSEPISNTNRVTQPENIFIAPGAIVEHSILNASTGPIYIGADAEVMEGTIIRGPFSLGENATVKMGAKIYGATNIGPHCKVGGEISNCVFQAYSNKGHDGFLGNAVIGEWCNLGADTNSSNLKNNYSNVKVYSYETNEITLTDVLFCGLLMGDHSKTGINTMLNTATVVGVSANIFGGGFPPKFIPSFTWGGVEKTDLFLLNKAFEVAENMMKRRKITLTDADKSILTHLFNNLA